MQGFIEVSSLRYVQFDKESQEYIPKYKTQLIRTWDILDISPIDEETATDQQEIYGKALYATDIRTDRRTYEVTEPYEDIKKMVEDACRIEK